MRPDTVEIIEQTIHCIHFQAIMDSSSTRSSNKKEKRHWFQRKRSHKHTEIHPAHSVDDLKTSTTIRPVTDNDTRIKSQNLTTDHISFDSHATLNVDAKQSPIKGKPAVKLPDEKLQRWYDDVELEDSELVSLV